MPHVYGRGRLRADGIQFHRHGFVRGDILHLLLETDKLDGVSLFIGNIDLYRLPFAAFARIIVQFLQFAAVIEPINRVFHVLFLRRNAVKVDKQSFVTGKIKIVFVFLGIFAESDLRPLFVERGNVHAVIGNRRARARLGYPTVHR